MDDFLITRVIGTINEGNPTAHRGFMPLNTENSHFVMAK